MKKKPTESELEILQVLWEKGASTVRAVNESLNQKKETGKETGYTTTLKLMQIMFEKGLITRDDAARTHIYAAAISEKTGQKQAVNRLIDSLFKGSSANLVMHALGNYRASTEEIAQIQQYLEDLKKNSLDPSGK